MLQVYDITSCDHSHVHFHYPKISKKRKEKLNQNKISEFKHTMISPLLSLVLPFCMVVPIRDLGNKSVFFSSNMHSLQSFQLPTVFSSNHTEMDQFFVGPSPDNYNKVRGRTISPSIQISRDSSVSSTKSSVAYYERMKHNNATIEDVDMNNVSPRLPNEMT